MDGPRLHGMQVENFRSIDRKVEVRLDAPVVLVHGQNGAGKTSLLAAIELALTGAVPSMERADARYKDQLLYKGAAEGSVVLDLQDVEGVTKAIEVKLNQKGLTATSHLNDGYAKFFSERCYLPQSLLTQLLTFYQESDARVDSLLSRFVSELLGLNRLDALELGLESARDLRNARKIAPSYAEVEQEGARLRRELNTARAQLTEAEAAIEQSRIALHAALTQLEIEMPTTEAARTALERGLRSSSEEQALVDLADRSRRLLALRREFARLAQDMSRPNAAGSEIAYEKAQQDLAAWRNRYSAEIDAALDLIRPFFPSAELQPETNPAQAIANAIAMTTAELERLEAIDAREQAQKKRSAELSEAVGRAHSRIATLDREIESVAIERGPLSVILSELFPHIHSENCPVCGRDYSEVSKEPLASHVAKRAAELSDQAQRLRALTTERTTLERDRSSLERENETIAARLLTGQAILDVQDRVTKLRNALPVLRTLQPIGDAGNSLLTAETTARQTLARITNATDAERSLRSALAEQAAFLAVTAPTSTEPLDAILDRLDASVRQTEVTLKALLEARNAAIQQLTAFNAHNRRTLALRQTIQRYEEDQERVTKAFNAAERVRNDVRQVLAATSNTRTMIVGQVFNDRLNSLWRDLFVRLAPGEAFVPAFRVPINPTRRLVPTLETRHRSGDTGGTPAAMLSAGNLNTAALTLFLALHLSVRPQLPWLILDDPVQSMDEVHIAQFAALLRTLAKEHRRQVIIAVHDRPLYDYLSLELSPAFAGDELITIELSKSADDHTRYVTQRRAFEPDTAFTPIAA